MFDHFLEQLRRKTTSNCGCEPLIVNIVYWNPNNADSGNLLRTHFDCFLDKTAGDLWAAYTSGARVMTRNEFDGGIEYSDLLCAAIVDDVYFYLIYWESNPTIFSAPSADAYPAKKSS